jgi:hypothetical protein
VECCEAGVSGSGLCKGFAILAVVRGELIDVPNQLRDRAERAASYGLAGDQREAAFHLVKP